MFVLCRSLKVSSAMATAVAAMLFLSTACAQTSTTVRIVATQDNSIVKAGVGEQNYGRATSLQVGSQGDVFRTLLYFPLGGISLDGQMVTRAELRMAITVMTDGARDCSSSSVPSIGCPTVHSITTRWGEGDKVCCDDSTGGESSWVHNSFPDLWRNVGGDFEEKIIGWRLPVAQFTTGITTAVFHIEPDRMEALIRGDGYFGFLLRDDDNKSVIYGSRESGRAPELVLVLTSDPEPTRSPTDHPTTATPLSSPTPMPTLPPVSPPTPGPTPSPTLPPVDFPPTRGPTPNPVASPTRVPTQRPVAAPTQMPTLRPIAAPTRGPTPRPVASPTRGPTPRPVASPTRGPTRRPTRRPTPRPVVPPPGPTPRPTARPVARPTRRPTQRPVASPTRRPTQRPITAPTGRPTPMPIAVPTRRPTPTPFIGPTPRPISVPTVRPTRIPTLVPVEPTTNFPTRTDFVATQSPTQRPTMAPVRGPTAMPNEAVTTVFIPGPTPGTAATTIPDISTAPPTIAQMITLSPTRRPAPDVTFSPIVQPPNNGPVTFVTACANFEQTMQLQSYLPEQEYSEFETVFRSELAALLPEYLGADAIITSTIVDISSIVQRNTTVDGEQIAVEYFICYQAPDNAENADHVDSYPTTFRDYMASEDHRRAFEAKLRDGGIDITPNSLSLAVVEEDAEPQNLPVPPGPTSSNGAVAGSLAATGVVMLVIVFILYRRKKRTKEVETAAQARFVLNANESDTPEMDSDIPNAVASDDGDHAPMAVVAHPNADVAGLPLVEANLLDPNDFADQDVCYKDQGDIRSDERTLTLTGPLAKVDSVEEKDEKDGNDDADDDDGLDV